MATASASLVEALGGHTTEVFGPVGSSDVLPR